MTSWPIKKLGEVCQVVAGGTPSTVVSNYWDGDILWVTPKDLGALANIEIIDTERKITKAGLENSSAKLFPPGSIILSTRAPIGHLAIAGKSMATNQGCKSFVCGKEIDKRYLYWVLKQNVETLRSLGTGATFTEISKTVVENFGIPLPPIEEQKKIVERIERLFAKINEASQLRNESSFASNALLPSALHHVFSRAIKEKWPVKDVGEICEKPQYGYTASANYGKVGPKFLRITDIQNGDVDWEQVPYCECETVPKYQLYSGDIVFARTGATVGKSFLIESMPEKAVFASYLIRLRARAMVMPKYLYAFFQSPDYWQQISGHQVGAAQPNVNASKLSKIKIPIPPIEEQKEIVSYLDSLSDKARVLQELQKQTATDLTILKHSILAQALGGAR